MQLSMITIIDPEKLQWETRLNLPNASLCHPDSRIITWNVVMNDYIEVAILAPHPDKGRDLWIDNTKKVWGLVSFKSDSMKWAWFRRFN